jgi:probable rRNA maturation factor
MSVTLAVQNNSTRKRLYRSDTLTRLAERICAGEDFSENTEVSLLLCDDPFIQELNVTYRKKNQPTDVLSFPQDADPSGARPLLGDIAISLETVERQFGGDRIAMREEVCLLFCHGMLHLLGYDHHTAADRDAMAAKQAAYLDCSVEDAWPSDPAVPAK